MKNCSYISKKIKIKKESRYKRELRTYINTDRGEVFTILCVGRCRATAGKDDVVLRREDPTV